VLGVFGFGCSHYTNKFEWCVVLCVHIHRVYKYMVRVRVVEIKQIVQVGR
jgi:hypothetical protein